MDFYINFVKTYPLMSSAAQFAVLGTLGEMIALFLKRKKLSTGWTPWVFIGKILAWAILGVIIKYGFIGMKGFVSTLFANNLLPAFLKSGVLYAFTISFFTNLFFGPQMMVFHRIEDNIIEGKWTFAGIEKAWFTLLWFWIPAHTITFSLPGHLQIGLAAVWGLVLGIILGTAKK